MLDRTRQKKKCSICGDPKSLDEFHRRRHTVRCGYRAACKACTREVRRLYQAKQTMTEEEKKEARLKARVRSRTQTAIKNGELIPQPCRVCGNPDSEVHHLSYEGPNAHLNVEWLCKTHHGLEHGKRAWTKQREMFQGLEKA